MAEKAQKESTDENKGKNDEQIENQFLLEAQTDVILPTRDDSVRKDAPDAKKIQKRQQNLNVLERVEQGGPRVESQRAKILPKDNPNVSKSKAKNKNVGSQTQNKMSQTKRRQYTLSKLSNPQNSVLRQSQKTAQMSPSIEANPKQLIDPLFLEEKIKEIAKNIRNKVKKDSSMDRHIEQISPKKVIKINGRQPKLNALRQSPLLVQKNYNQTINPYQVLQTKLLTFDQSITIQPNPKKIVKSIITKLILQKVQKQIDTRERTKSKKLKLDPINHHYPMTSFRKSIIEEIKVNTLRESQKQKERQAKLNKRRDIYNSSRYQRYAKLGYLLKGDFEEHKMKGEQTIVLLSRVNPEQGLSKMRSQTSAIIQIDSLIQFVNSSGVKVQQEKQSNLGRESSYSPSLDNIRV